MKITEIKGIPEKLLKKDTLDLYKAYFFTEDAQEEDDNKMQFDQSIDMFGITPEAAVSELLLSLSSEVIVGKLQQEILNLGDFPIKEKDRWIYETMLVSLEGKVGDQDIVKVEMNNAKIAMLQLQLDMDDLKEKDLLDDPEESHFKNDVLGIRLSDKKYEIKVMEKNLVSFQMMISPEGKEITKIKLTEEK